MDEICRGFEEAKGRAMSIPEYKKKKNGIPIISKDEMDRLGEALVADFCPEALEQPMRLDIDRFIRDYLGMSMDYKHLSNNGVYLGMTVFCDSDMVPVYDAVKKEADFISVEAGTVLIEKSLTSKLDLPRYRYTAAHEAGHGFLHSVYFTQNAGSAAARAQNGEAVIRCRIESLNLPRQKEWTDNDWMEWQADRFASALLMPRHAVLDLLAKDKTERDEFWAAKSILSVAQTFAVSKQAAEIRLRDVGALKGFTNADLDYGMSFFPGQRRIRSK